MHFLKIKKKKTAQEISIFTIPSHLDIYKIESNLIVYQILFFNIKRKRKKKGKEKEKRIVQKVTCIVSKKLYLSLVTLPTLRIY